jgi:hypothetical protein
MLIDLTEANIIDGGGFIFTTATITGLPKFDSSLGTLDSITLSANFDFGFSSDIEAEAINFGQPGNAEIFADFNIFVGYSPSGSPGTTFTSLGGSGDFSGYSFGCSFDAETAFCQGFDGDHFSFDDVADILTDANPLTDFVGIGDIGTLAVIIAMETDANNAILNNADFAVGGISVDVSAGDIGIEYDYTPTVIPVPAAIWLFATGVIGLLGVNRNQRKTTC